MTLFKRRAAASSHEVLAFLIGTITKENDKIVAVAVESLYYPPQDKGRDYVEWNPTDVVRLQAQILPKAIVGTLHSHPSAAPHLSREDIQTADQFGEIISGVYSYWKVDGRRRTSLDWYYGLHTIRHKVV